MTEDSPRRNCGLLTALLALSEAVLLYAVFVIAEWIWPLRDFLEGK